MKLFESNTEILRRSSPAKLSKRFVCWVIDLILVAILAEVIFTCAFGFVQKTDAYVSAQKTIEEEIAYYEELTQQTHIVEYEEGKRASTESVVLKNLYRAICLSYETFGNDQRPEFKYEPTHEVAAFGTHSLENDNVAYFYTCYLPSDSVINVDAESDIFKVYRRAFGENADLMFTFDRGVSDIPVLNTQVAYCLFHYMFVNETDSIGKSGAAYFESFCNAYANMLEEAETLILKSEPYYSTRYADYVEAYTAEARCTNIAFLISLFISCFVILLIPKYLFKNEKTIGYKLFGLGVINGEGEANKWYVPLIKTVFECFGSIPIAVILYMFPPFNGGFDAMFVPMTVGSKISLGLIVLAVVVIGGIVNAFGLFTSKRQNLINILFNDVVVDVNLMDTDEEKRNHGRDY